MTFNEIVDGIFLINLDQYPENLEKSKEEMSKIGIKVFTIFPGILINNGETFEDRLMGCALSHIGVIKKAKEKNLKRILILEDDIEFHPNTNNYLHSIDRFMNENKFDLFYLGGNVCLCNYRDMTNVANNIVKIKGILTTHAYIISSDAYDILINIFNNPSLKLTKHTALDNYYINYVQNRGRSYVLNPRIAYQRAGFSYIENSYQDYSGVLK